METLEKKEYLNRLFELYGSLLTKKQVQSFLYYYVDDYSLQEIAELLSVSRNAIYDQLQKVEKHLHDYESKLHLYEKQQRREQRLKQLEKELKPELMDVIRKLDE